MRSSKHNTAFLILTIFLSAIIGNTSFSQSSANTLVGEFEILVTETEKGIALKCKSGCAWTDLSFTIKNTYKPYGIGELGMLDIKEENKVKQGKLQNFFFTVQKTDKGLKFKGIGGTAWVDLSYSSTIDRVFKLTQEGAMKVNEPD